MPIELASIYGSEYVGAFCLATDKYALIPRDADSKFQRLLEENLGVLAYRVTIGSSPIIGILAAGNSYGIVLPFFILDDELTFIKKEIGVEVVTIPPAKTALGNMILVNDKAAIVHNDFTKNEMKMIEDALNVEVVKGSLGGIRLVGSVAVANNKGALLHPLTSEDEVKWVSEVMKVRADVGTVMMGSPLLRIAMVLNSKGALIAPTTTGPELARIEQILFL
ncbi:MAG: translation initiation factor IF-6 [Candidatus Nezhaarchaeota archaeon]|nr:translation initiation factor IF-6 [Candidatus Nezhaarchaeota archaeon]MCX8142120.1 translation initiation factor IF-6 [Candidatus Nezhaarchaeota archaeon]MDW8050099.1 translation initiation factor IF-6 [Nitrososphaerota archaeon]